MRSWRFHKFGSIRDLQMDEIAIPQPADDECLVKIAYAALNPADRLLIMGLYPTNAKPPFSIGRDGSGTVVNPGKSGRFKKGDRVVFLRSIIGISRDGTLADYVTVPEAHVAHLPDWWTFADGAAGPHALLTSWQALHEVAQVQPNETVLISGASGGIGTGSLLLARLKGARIIALSRSPAKRDKLIGLGADFAFDPNDENLVKQVKDLGGVDVAVDTVSGDLLAQILIMARSHARICIIGALGGIRCRIDPTRLIFKRLQIHGIQVAMYSDAGVQKAWQEIIDLIRPYHAKVQIDQIYPFEDVPRAFEHLKKGPMGKVLVGPMDQELP